MARPGETYRAARRNHWRSAPKRSRIVWSENLLDGSSWKKPFDPSHITSRPYLARGWDYSKGGREKFNSVRDHYFGMKKQYRRFMRGGKFEHSV